jgi:putative peptidoglycan lipid II flippase
MFRHDLTRQGEQAAWATASVLLNNLAIVLLLIALISGVAAPYLVSLMAPGFAQETGTMATLLVRLSIACIVFVGMGNVLAQLFFSYERFFIPGFVPSVDNVIVLLAFFVLGSMYGIYGLAIAVVIGAAAEFALQLPIVWQKRRFYQTKVDLRHPAMVEMGRLSFPLLISAGGIELGRITDRIFASLLPVGSLSALAFASRIVNLFYDFFIRPLQRSTFPHFAKLSAEEDFQALSRHLFRYLRMVAFLTVPVGIGLMVLAEPLVRVVFQRGAFDETSVRLTNQALWFYAIGFPATCMSRILDRTFYSLKNTRIPSRLALARVAIKILLSWLLIHPLAHLGLALAESLSQIVRLPLLYIFLPNPVKGQEGWKTMRSCAKTLVASLLMGVIMSLVQNRIHGFFPLAVELLVLTLLGMPVYAGITLLFQGEELASLLQLLKILKGRYLPQKS